MIEQPTLDELNTQLGLLRAWLPHMAGGLQWKMCCLEGSQMMDAARCFGVPPKSKVSSIS